MENIGFIGMGNMAQAIAKGFINSKKIAKEKIFAFAPNQQKLKTNAEKIGFTPVSDLVELVKKCGTLIIACKPYQIDDVLSQIKSHLAGKVLLSVAAGWVFDSFSSAFLFLVQAIFLNRKTQKKCLKKQMLMALCLRAVLWDIRLYSVRQENFCSTVHTATSHQKNGLQQALKRLQ